MEPQAEWQTAAAFLQTYLDDFCRKNRPRPALFTEQRLAALNGAPSLGFFSAMGNSRLVLLIIQPPA